MKGMTMNEFLDKVYYGDEIEFLLYGITYFIQGYSHDKKFILTVDYWTATDGSESPHDYLLELACDSAEERVRQFEAAMIFNGKSIYEVEADIDVQFG